MKVDFTKSLKLQIFTFTLLLALYTGNIAAQENTDIETIEVLKRDLLNYKFEEKSYKYGLKRILWTKVQEDIEVNANLLGLFLLESDDPFFYISGATYEHVGKYIDEFIYHKVSIYLLNKLKYSNDFWYDIQQIGRWLGEDFVPTGDKISREKTLKIMYHNMLEFYETEYAIVKVANK